MARKTLKRIQGDFTTETLQRNVEDFVRSSIPDWISDGVMLSNVTLAAGLNPISHTLQRQPLGFVITDKTSNAVVWRTTWNDTTLTLQASLATTVQIWVF